MQEAICSLEVLGDSETEAQWAAGGSIFDMLNRDDRASWRAKASYSLEGLHATIAITVVTFFALFMDDFRLAILPTQLDVSCEYISGLILVRLTHPSFMHSKHLPSQIMHKQAEQVFWVSF